MMKMYLGIDTSNYTTSCALYKEVEGIIVSKKQLLPVAENAKGLRQSDAVFHHSRNLPGMLECVLSEFDSPCAVSASYAPRDSLDSYMPCFTVGNGYSKVISSALNIPRYEFSHQAGHIAAAVYSAGKTELIGSRFIAFHFSGGTTDALFVEFDEDRIFNIHNVFTSLDLKAGQAVDRVGVLLGLRFPAGAELEKLAKQSEKKYDVKLFFRDGNVSLSGIENKCRDMFLKGEDKCDIARYCIDSLRCCAYQMCVNMREKFGNIPVLYAGGVMSDSIIREDILSRVDNCYFAEPEFSADNAAGTAYLAYIKENL
ncbi:MAG: peptidase M22 [Oscillospiraceae bacterium]|nr:peptidase M22 [Oscillospiraceae bacterium]